MSGKRNKTTQAQDGEGEADEPLVERAKRALAASPFFAGQDIDQVLARSQPLPNKQTVPGGSVPYDAKAIRAWAIARGMAVGARGRLTHEVRTAYQEAHSPQPTSDAE